MDLGSGRRRSARAFVALLSIGAGLVLADCSAANATVRTVDDTADLLRALHASHAGDTVLLKPGTYSEIAIRNLNIDGTVTVQPADPRQPAVLTNFSIISSSGLTFRGLELFANNPKGFGAFMINGSSRIAFEHLNVHGSLDGDPSDDQHGIEILKSTNIRIADSEFQQLSWAVVEGNSDHISIIGNNFHDIRSDGIDNAASSFVTIAQNSFSDFYPNPGDHPDAIEYWTAGTTTPSHDIMVSDNMFTRGAGKAIQGVFFRDSLGNLPFTDVTIVDNTFVGSAYNGIAVLGGQNVRIENNEIQSFTGREQQSWIRLAKINGAVLKNNRAGSFINTGNAAVSDAGNRSTPPVSGADKDADTALVKAGAAAPANARRVYLWGTGLKATAHPTGGAVLVSFSGGNTLVGGAGGDVFRVFHANDSIVVAPGTPNETVETTVSFTLPANVQNLRGRGGADLTLVGNAMGNVITPNSGADTLTGGAGDDTFVFAPDQKLETVTDFDANGDHDRLDLTAYVAAGQRPVIEDHGTFASIGFGNGDTIRLPGVHAAALSFAGGFVR